MYNETATTIEFVYPVESIFDELSVLSTYAAKNMPITSKVEDAVDAYGISSDEKDFFKIQLSKALTSLFSYYVNQSSTIPDSMFVSKEFNSIECCGFSIKREVCNGQSLYNPNRLSILDDSNKNYLQNYILFEWAKTNSLADSVTIYKMAIEQNIAEIRKNNFELKKRLLGKSYDIFPSAL